MQGKIIKGIAGFYYVHVPQAGIYECKAKGIFRNQKKKPLVGDNVIIEILDKEQKIGTIIDILERTNALIRPAVSNIDQAVVVFAAASPMPNFNLLDRFLVAMSKQKINTIICFNKCDLIDREKEIYLQKIYAECGSEVMFVSAVLKQGVEQLKLRLESKTTVLAGPSGVGKSTLINDIYPKANMETGEISKKIERGKHTTRHSELFLLGGSTYIVDTPGFSSLYLDNIEINELKEYFLEFIPYEKYCRFNGCIHIGEPDCRVKEALSEEKINKERYKNYKLLYNEIKEKKRY